MAELTPDIEEQLLAYHMGWLNRAEMEAIDRLIESSPDIAQRSAELAKSIAPLEDFTALPTLENLETEVLRAGE